MLRLPMGPLFDVRTIGGRKLDIWNRRMRLIYLDEAGVSNPSHEPHLVFAGFIINADAQWRDLDRHLKSLMRKWLPEDMRYHGVFQAKNIWHGTKNFHRDRWPHEKRLALFHELTSIPRKFDLPIVVGAVDRIRAGEWSKAAWVGGRNSGATDPFIHCEAFVRAVQDADRWIGSHHRNEVASVVCEKAGKIDGVMKMFHGGYSDTSPDSYYVDRNYPNVFRAKYIIDSLHFAEKHEAGLLQIADTCAFTIRRHLDGKADIKPFFDDLAPQVISDLHREIPEPPSRRKTRDQTPRRSRRLQPRAQS